MFESRIDAIAHPGLTAASDLLGRNLCQTIPINALRSPSPASVPRLLETLQYDGARPGC
jgi:hypothetical protein